MNNFLNHNYNDVVNLNALNKKFFNVYLSRKQIRVCKRSLVEGHSDQWLDWSWQHYMPETLLLASL